MKEQLLDPNNPDCQYCPGLCCNNWIGELNTYEASFLRIGGAVLKMIPNDGRERLREVAKRYPHIPLIGADIEKESYVVTSCGYLDEDGFCSVHDSIFRPQACKDLEMGSQYCRERVQEYIGLDDLDIIE